MQGHWKQIINLLYGSLPPIHIGTQANEGKTNANISKMWEADGLKIQLYIQFSSCEHSQQFGLYGRCHISK